MSTYYNCYELVSEIRRKVNDYSTGKVQGTDTSGAFKNEEIIKAINDAQMHVFNALFPLIPHLFLTSSTLAGTSSVYTLPADFYQLRKIETSDGLAVDEIDIDSKHVASEVGSLLKYYRQGSTFVIDKDSVTANYTGWYYKRPRNITMGMASAGGANSITLASSARKELSYYVGMTIEDITADFTSAISAYTAARVATVVGTAATSDYYGIVSDLPEQFHGFIGQGALIDLKGMPQSPVPLLPGEKEAFDLELKKAIESYSISVRVDDKTGETSTYHNCYKMVAEVRRALNDFSIAKLRGIDRKGLFLNESIIQAINDAQIFVFDKLFPRKPYLFLTSAVLTGVASVYTLPSDFYQLHRFEDANGIEAKEIPIDSRHEAAQTGSLWKFYRQGKTLVLDKDSITSNYTGWYYKRPRMITMGMSSAGGTSSITLAPSARAEGSYYVGMTIEDITADLTSNISAYTAARVATIVGTPATSDYYGIVSELPEEFHHLIYRRAAMKLKSMPQSKVPVTPPEIKEFDEDMQAALDSYCGRVVSPDLTGEGGTYYNCYKIVADVRRTIGDYSVEKLQGKDLTGPYLNETVIKAINDAQKYLFDLIFVRKPHLFLTSTTITGSSSEYTLPSDFFKLRLFDTSDRVQIHPIPVTQRHLNDDGGSKYLYYRKGAILRVDKDSLADVNTLWYYKRPRNITMGRVQTGGASSMTLAISARAEASYYLNMTIENVTADFSSTISAYTAARVATVAGTSGVADFYGLVSELPEGFHHLISRKADLLLRSSPVKGIVPVSLADAKFFNDDLIETIRSYCGDADDETIEDQILNLEPFIS